MFECQHLLKSFSFSFRPILNNLSLRLSPGDFCTIIGSNGSGKSTFLKTISGEYTPDSGHVLLNGLDITKDSIESRATHIRRVFQDVGQGIVNDLTLLENLALSGIKVPTSQSCFYETKRPYFHALLEGLGLGLEHYLNSPLSCLSGGQRQIIATLMAIEYKPDLLLLDEHTSALDFNNQRYLMEYTAKAVAQHQITTMMVTHHLNDALRYGNRLVVFHQGKIMHDFQETEKKQLTIDDLLELFHAYEDQTLVQGDGL